MLRGRVEGFPLERVYAAIKGRSLLGLPSWSRKETWQKETERWGKKKGRMEKETEKIRPERRAGG